MSNFEKKISWWYRFGLQTWGRDGKYGEYADLK